MAERCTLVDLTDPTAVLQRMAELRIEEESLHDLKGKLEAQIGENEAEWFELQPIAAHYLGEEAVTLSAYNSVDVRHEFITLAATDGWVEARREIKPGLIEPLTQAQIEQIQADADRVTEAVRSCRCGDEPVRLKDGRVLPFTIAELAASEAIATVADEAQEDLDEASRGFHLPGPAPFYVTD